MIKAMKTKLSMIMIASLGIASCGKIDESTISDTETPKVSAASIVGNYSVAPTTCRSGLFKTDIAGEVLKENDILDQLAATNQSVNIELSEDKLKTSGPSTFFGGTRTACKVTVISSVTFKENKLMTVQDLSKSCSNTCAVEDCTANANLNAGVKSYKINEDGKNLKLTKLAGANICETTERLLVPSEINWIRK